MGKKFLKFVFAILFFVCRLQADTIWTSGYHEINPSDPYYNEVWLYNDATLKIFGSEIGKLEVFDTTSTSFYNGCIDALRVNESSIVNIYYGQLGYLAAGDNCLINLYAYDVLHTTTGGAYGIGQVTGKYYLNNSQFSFDLKNDDAYSHISIVPEPATLILLALGGLILKKK